MGYRRKELLAIGDQSRLWGEEGFFSNAIFAKSRAMEAMEDRSRRQLAECAPSVLQCLNIPSEA